MQQWYRRSSSPQGSTPEVNNRGEGSMCVYDREKGDRERMCECVNENRKKDGRVFGL
jgi:hypothetical protein